jgi:hypothetical protein
MELLGMSYEGPGPQEQGHKGPGKGKKKKIRRKQGKGKKGPGQKDDAGQGEKGAVQKAEEEAITLEDYDYYEDIEEALDICTAPST